MDIDDTVTEELSLLCESGELKEGTVYRVINDGRGYRLEEVNV